MAVRDERTTPKKSSTGSVPCSFTGDRAQVVWAGLGAVRSMWSGSGEMAATCASISVLADEDLFQPMNEVNLENSEEEDDISET